ncbi:MAG: SDR family NAD(P)-dependent oxidoreductase [Pseudomonadota bacterium]
METLEGKIAVVTGAASGIGFGMAEAFANRGMCIVISDVEETALQESADRLRQDGHDVTPCLTDVRNIDAVQELLDTAVQTYGKAHVLCNNAGVSGSITATGPAPVAIWEANQQDWDWVMGVNLQGVINGLRVFLPHMLSHEEESHVVNTSSIMGLTTGVGSTYGVSKHAVARLTEGLFHDLRAREANIGTTLLCPGLIATNIITSARNLPDEYKTEGDIHPDRVARLQQMDNYFKTHGMPPRKVGELVADAMLNRQFYLLTHPENMEGVERRFQDILNLRDPTPPPVWNMQNDDNG